MLPSVKIPAVILLLSTLVGCGAGQTENDHINRANKAVAQGDTAAATIEFRNALQLNPSNGTARLALGSIYLEAGQYPAAEKELSIASTANIDRSTVIPLLAKALIQQGKSDEVLALDTTNLSTEASVDLLVEQANAYLLQNKSAPASRVINKALALDPSSAEARTIEARLLYASNPQGAEEKLEELLTEQTSYTPAWALLGEIRTHNQEPAEAEAAFDRVLENETNASGMDYLRRALARIQQGKLDRAQEDISKARTKIPGYHEIDFAQGMIHFYQGDLESAKDSLDMAYSHEQNFPPTIFYLAAVNYQLGDVERADYYATTYVDKNNQAGPAIALLARIRLLQQRYVEADDLLIPLLEISPEDPAILSLRARALNGQGKTDKEVVILEKLSVLQTNFPSIHLRLASAYKTLGYDEKALSEWQSALEVDPAYTPAAEALVNHYAAKAEPVVGLQVARGFYDQNPDSVDALNLLGLAYVFNKNYPNAQAEFEKARAKDPGNRRANHNLANIALIEGNFSEARKRYEEVLSLHKNNLDTLMRLAALEQAEGNEKQRADILTRAIEAHPEAPEPKFLLAEYYVKSGNTKKLSQLYDGTLDASSHMRELEKILKRNPNNFVARLNLAQLYYKRGETSQGKEQLDILKKTAPDAPEVQLLEAKALAADKQDDNARDQYLAVYRKVPSETTMLALVMHEWQMGQQASAIKRLQDWLTNDPSSVRAMLQLASYYSRIGNRENAIAQYEKVLETSENNVLALNNLAWELLDGDPTRALELAKEAAKLAPESPVVADTLAMALLKSGQPEKALSVIEQKTRKADLAMTNPDLLYHQALALEALGRNEEAERVLSTLLGANKDFPERPKAKELVARLRGQ